MVWHVGMLIWNIALLEPRVAIWLYQHTVEHFPVCESMICCLQRILHIIILTYPNRSVRNFAQNIYFGAYTMSLPSGLYSKILRWTKQFVGVAAVIRYESKVKEFDSGDVGKSKQCHEHFCIRLSQQSVVNYRQSDTLRITGWHNWMKWSFAAY